MSERSERNRKIAEWLGISHRHTVSHDEQQAEQSDPCDLCGVARHSHNRGIPDFYTSEEASALVLDALKRPYPYFSICFNTERSKTEFEASGLSTNRNWCWETEITDRKTAIAEAALRLIETGGQR